jgi:glyoxylase-like metal-dependent hydrolase (beta-lactamase superfamily II)
VKTRGTPQTPRAATARGALAVALLASAFTAGAADAPAPARGSNATAMSVELVKPGLYRINGGGGSTLLRLGSNGLVVVDSNRAGLYGPLLTEIQGIAKGVPVGALVLTATGPGQIGNVAQFVDAGIPVVVQQRAQARVAGVARAGGSTSTKPLITYGDDYQLHVGNVDAAVEYVGSGRTGADSVVHFPDLRAVAVGELFTAAAPEPDCASGGSFAGWAAAIAQVLWLNFDVAIPSRGAPVGKPELEALQAKLEGLAERGGTSPSGPSDCRPPH